MSPSTSVSEATTQEQQTIEEAFVAVYVAARTNGTIPTPADGLQCIVDAERKVAGMEATAARVAASKGTKRVHWIEEAQSHDEPRAFKIRSRKSTGDTTEDLSPESMDARESPISARPEVWATMRRTGLPASGSRPVNPHMKERKRSWQGTPRPGQLSSPLNLLRQLVSAYPRGCNGCRWISGPSREGSPD